MPENQWLASDLIFKILHDFACINQAKELMYLNLFNWLGCIT
jgi:hypothetical protein